MDQRHNVRTQAIKHLEKNIGVNLHDLGFSQGFLAMTLKAPATKGKKIEEMRFIKMTNFVL